MFVLNVMLEPKLHLFIVTITQPKLYLYIIACH